MNSTRSSRFPVVAVLLTAAWVIVWAASPRPQPVRADDPKPNAPFEFSEKVVAGGPSDFMEVRHLVLRGSNYDIGRKLAEVARQRHAVALTPSRDKLRTRAERTYFQRNYPIHFERMRGAASVFGVDVHDDAYNFAGLPFGITRPGCTVVYYPPQLTADGIGVLSRNYDFTTGTLAGRVPGPGESPCSSRPYMIEMYPDSGFASLYVCAYDLLGSAIDGINSEGLSVAILADDELMELGKADPAPATQAGLEVITVTRFLLDTCATVEDAKVALLSSRLYYSIIPCHYMVADRHGKAFIWENASTMHYGNIVENDGAPLLTTNFMHYLHPEARDPAKAHEPFKTCNRYQAVRDRLTSASGKLSVDFIKQTHASVMMTRLATPPRAAARTLWHSLYYPEQRKMEVDFYLGETPAADPGGKPTVRRSGYLSFALKDEGRIFK